MQLSHKRRTPSAVDLTPLIDIIFQLVLFFMVSTQFVSSPGIEVDLPRSSADTILKERDDLKVWVRADGSIYLNESPISGTALREAMSEAAKRDPNTMIIIKADKKRGSWLGGAGHGHRPGARPLAPGHRHRSQHRRQRRRRGRSARLVQPIRFGNTEND